MTDDAPPIFARLEQLEEMTESDLRISDLARERVGATVRHVKNALTFVGQPKAGASLIPRFSTALNEKLGELPALLPRADDLELVSWARSVQKVLRTELEEVANYGAMLGLDGGEIKEVSFLLRRVASNEERLALVEDDLKYRSYAADLVEKAEDTASKLQAAAGIAGDASLAEHFERYARREWWSANIFRGLTILAIGGAVVLAVALPKPTTGDWVTLSYRLAQLVGVAALATYFGRQAAQHRRVFNWARSMQVQLQSFPAFIEPVTDADTRGGIYGAFARRVLGAPPEKGGSSDEAYPNQQVIELLTALAKKA